MNYMELLQQIFQVCILPLLGVLTAYLVALIKKKTDEIKAKTDNELYDKYITMLRDIVIDCVTTTNQTYVEALKDKNAFDKEAQEEAFNLTYNAVMDILADEAKEYLDIAIGDLNNYIVKMIESQVNFQKNQSVE